ncbi:MAG: PaREP1 family protein [Dehalococcoidia bacterium]|nr:PaREP1 family protein [Dehalococcoidia bacterium]MDH5781875.1 PaREP1 family protein [Dehalococcoidia bacterium]
MQASEKLYKAAEEAVKALSQVYANGVWKEVAEKGRWTSPLLFRAVTEIAKNLKNEEIRRYWNTAWTLHVEGFHEGRLEIDYVKEEARDIEELVNLAEIGIDK